MANSILNLKIETGPKTGETLTLNPKTLTCIGRIVKGNTLSIRDPNISEKHLAIRFLPKSSSWVITDLNSSNGTFVNGSRINPNKPYPLADGDIIKIGQKSSILVRVCVPKDEILQRVERREMRSHVKKKMKEEEDGGLKGKNGVLEEMLNGENRVRVCVPKDEILQRVERREMMPSVKKIKEEDGGLKGKNRVEEVEDDIKIESKGNDGGVEEEMVNGENRVRVDMDNMTVGEWIDRLKEYLPKEINKAAQKVIDQLNEKARLFDEYVSQL